MRKRFAIELALLAVLALASVPCRLFSKTESSEMLPSAGDKQAADENVWADVATCLDTISPVHDWCVVVGGRAYGLTQWGSSDCSIYFGKRIATWQVPAVAVAGLFLLMIILATGYFVKSGPTAHAC